MAHALIPTQEVPRSRPQPIPDPEALARAVMHVGPEFRGLAVVAVFGVISS